MISPGKILFRAYYGPRNKVKHILKTGVRRHFEIEAGRAAMIKAAGCLRELAADGQHVYQVYFLTGKKYWYQTAFCLASLQQHLGRGVHGVFVDDGSFDQALCSLVKNTFPSSRIILKEEVAAQLNAVLPADQYPTLRSRRLVYPHLRKLTDVHIFPSERPKLVLDSDMLFFRKPEALLSWLEDPQEMLFMEDIETAYGYSETLMREMLRGLQVPEKINVGVAGIDSAQINWHELEHWTRSMLEREGSSYLQEQALTAMIAASHSPLFLDKDDYKVLPQIKADKIPEVLHHYVADSKYDYFTKGWQQVHQGLSNFR